MMLCIWNCTEHLLCVSMHKELEDKWFFLLRLQWSVVRTNIYSAAGGDVCRLQFAQLVSRWWAEQRTLWDRSNQPQPLFTSPGGGHSRHSRSLSSPWSTLRTSQSFLSITLLTLIKFFSAEFASVIKVISLSTCSTWSLAVSIDCTWDKSLFSPWSSFNLLQHYHQLKLEYTWIRVRQSPWWWITCESKKWYTFYKPNTSFTYGRECKSFGFNWTARAKVDFGRLTR